MSASIIEHVPARAAAEAYQKSAEEIREAMATISNAVERIKKAFAADSKYEFNISVDIGRTAYYVTDEGTVDSLMADMKRQAWCVLVDKLQIRKVMSAKRQDEMDKALQDRHQWKNADTDPLPEITAENIESVAGGFAASIEEFMAEAVREEYDFWKPWNSEHKTNSQFVLNPKVIRKYMVERTWEGRGWRPGYTHRGHLAAIDRIFHQLDGIPIMSGVRGPLDDAICLADADGHGETDYFRFRCCKNGNLHLEFKRKDLLDRFNLIAGRNRLPQRDSATGKAK